MPDLQGIRREALKDVIKDLKVMKQVCYPTDNYEAVDCKNCESYVLCNTVFGVTTPRQILNKLKEGTR